MPSVKVAKSHDNGQHPSIKKYKYKHTLRKSPYFVSLVFLLIATVLTILNIYVPDLIHIIVKSPGPIEFETKYGLYQRCTRTSPSSNSTGFLAPAQPLANPTTAEVAFDPFITFSELNNLKHHGHRDHPLEEADEGWKCESFPTRSECAEFGEKFCVLWSTAGYLAQSCLVPCLAALFSLLFIFLHRGQRTARARARRGQWKLVSGTMAVHFVLQVISFSLIAHVFRTDGRFEAKGSHLDKSFTFGVLAAVASGLMVSFLTYTGYAAKRGEAWAAGRSARRARRHKRTRSGQVVAVPEGQAIPPDQEVTIGEVEAARVGPAGDINERTGLLEGVDGSAAGGGARATD